jgi:hypothetical protein
MYVAKVGEQVHGAKLSPDVVYTDLRACILICGKCVLYPSAPDSIIGSNFRITLALWFCFFFSFLSFLSSFLLSVRAYVCLSTEAEVYIAIVLSRASPA